MEELAMLMCTMHLSVLISIHIFLKKYPVWLNSNFLSFFSHFLAFVSPKLMKSSFYIENLMARSYHCQSVCQKLSTVHE